MVAYHWFLCRIYIRNYWRSRAIVQQVLSEIRTNQQIVATRAANEVFAHCEAYYVYLFRTVYINGTKGRIGCCSSGSTFFLCYEESFTKDQYEMVSSDRILCDGISGVIMLVGFAKAQKDENASLYTSWEKGFRSHLTWSEDNYTIEFKWSEGFEFEKVITTTSYRKTRNVM